MLCGAVTFRVMADLFAILRVAFSCVLSLSQVSYGKRLRYGS